MSSSKKSGSKLAKVRDLLDSLDEDKSLTSTTVVIAVEFDSDGVPMTVLRRDHGNPAGVMAGLAMVEKLVKDGIKNWHDKIDSAGEMSNTLKGLLEKLGVDSIDEVIAKFPDQAEELKDIISKLRGDFDDEMH